MERSREKTRYSRARDTAGPPKSRLRVVLANEPLVYREVISATIRALRPRFEVFTKEPG